MQHFDNKCCILFDTIYIGVVDNYLTPFLKFLKKLQRNFSIYFIFFKLINS